MHRIGLLFCVLMYLHGAHCAYPTRDRSRPQLGRYPAVGHLNRAPAVRANPKYTTKPPPPPIREQVVPVSKKSNARSVIFIHIGKCGGASIRSFLKDNNVLFHTVHWGGNAMQKLSYAEKVVMVVRDPLERTISAFNWRSPVGGRPDKFPQPHTDQEKEMYQNCDYNISTFIKSFSHESKCTRLARVAMQRMGHIARGYEFYLKGALGALASHDVLLVRNNHYDSDFDLMVKWLGFENATSVPEVHMSYPLRSAKPVVSDEEMKVFKQMLSKEYQIYESVLQKFLRPEQRED